MAEYKAPVKGQAVIGEYSDNSTPGGGLYRHPESGQEVMTTVDPLFGDTQSQAVMRLGFEFVRPLKEGDIKTMVAASIDKENQPTANLANADDLKGLLARVNALESENSTLKNEIAAENPVPGTEAVKGADETKDAAVEQTEARDESSEGSQNEAAGTTDPAPEASEKPLEKQNKEELVVTAEAEGVEVLPEDTKANIVEKIETLRAGSDSETEGNL